ncbi:MAG: ferritin-like domain-containing protein [Burkholderiaceae bacterium]
MQAPHELRQSAYNAFISQNIEQKMALADVLLASTAINNIAKIELKNTLTLPGLPEKPELREPLNVDKRSPFTPAGHAALMHAICHIEFNAVNLALDAIWRFDGMPEQYYRDWAQVAKEEAYHFTLLQNHLKSIAYDENRGYEYGDFPAHTGLWAMCEKTKDDIVARMALVPRTLEARGLDATPLIQAKLHKVKTPDATDAIDILDIILRDEIGHVAIGNHWYRWLCQRDGLDPLEHYVTLHNRHAAPKLRAPFNTEARLKAGFTPQEIAFLSTSA